MHVIFLTHVLQITHSRGLPVNTGREDPLLVFVGAATLDTIAAVAGYPGPDSRTVAQELVIAGGGPAATAAVAASRLGARTAFVGAVGDDDEGDRILAALRAEGVDVAAAVRLPGCRSGASVVVVDTAEATRAIVTRPVPPLDVASNERVRELLARAAWVHADHLGWPALRALDRTDYRFRLSVDGGNPIPGFTPDGVDLYVPTIERLAAEAGRAGLAPERLLQDVLDAGARTVVATDGPRGSWGLDEKNGLVHAPASRASVRSTLGAGDVFHGALLAAVAAGDALPAALRLANTIAAKSCEGLDGRSGIPRTPMTQILTPAPAHR